MNARKWLEENNSKLRRVFRWADGSWKEIDVAEVEEDDRIEEIEEYEMENLILLAD